MISIPILSSFLLASIDTRWLCNLMSDSYHVQSCGLILAVSCRTWWRVRRVLRRRRRFVDRVRHCAFFDVRDRGRVDVCV
ncbi:hypothetical protein BGW36DRAFT_372474 [Talaromyces proteolyticus]|uniref:Uncharacterized protein n=1 Tax=Talaromyces proteolyticus TaxID=1131652 RepID=A0AAD4KYQ2_9EURO|nr:uncharacterized protein BGW36DRAFT_372474 [Talaromyces proteolyticus]KAH8702243.1 hypothetical protein BGW36DRAFT_372474 [Talaromyces proteolyticus]